MWAVVWEKDEGEREKEGQLAGETASYGRRGGVLMGATSLLSEGGENG
jgi:hypothetical protein